MENHGKQDDDLFAGKYGPAFNTFKEAIGHGLGGGSNAANDFTIKDSGKREEYKSGMVRDTTEGKTMWSLVADGPMLKRWAEHLTKGAIKYAVRNWMKADGDEEMNRAKDSAFRHFMQWLSGETDEDHAAAVFFNINEVEYIKGRKS